MALELDGWGQSKSFQFDIVMENRFNYVEVFSGEEADRKQDTYKSLRRERHNG